MEWLSQKHTRKESNKIPVALPVCVVFVFIIFSDEVIKPLRSRESAILPYSLNITRRNFAYLSNVNVVLDGMNFRYVKARRWEERLSLRIKSHLNCSLIVNALAFAIYKRRRVVSCIDDQVVTSAGMRSSCASTPVRVYRPIKKLDVA